ncbi:hypothetical protein [Flavobacterium sp. ZB4P13]|uniref:hypothetical protein n=1 Tax=Flavobacterium sp. ZB4P13 TaxID=3401728 RepID=UPI003AAB0774
MNNPDPDQVPQIIFIDLNITGKNDFDIFEEIKNLIKYNNTSIIIFSTSSELETIS